MCLYFCYPPSMCSEPQRSLAIYSKLQNAPKAYLDDREKIRNSSRRIGIAGEELLKWKKIVFN